MYFIRQQHCYYPHMKAKGFIYIVGIFSPREINVIYIVSLWCLNSIKVYRYRLRE